MVESLLTPPVAATEPTGTGTAAPAATPNTPPASGTAPTPNADGKQTAPAATPPATPAPKAPEAYKLTLPESGEFNDAVRTAYEGVARKHNLTNEAAQEILNEVAPKLAERRAAQIDAQIKATREGWYAASLADKDIGGDKLKDNLATASKAVALGGPELPAFLKETGLDLHPVVIKWAIAVGKALSPDRIVSSGQGGPSAERKSDASVIFGTVDKK